MNRLSPQQQLLMWGHALPGKGVPTRQDPSRVLVSLPSLPSPQGPLQAVDISIDGLGLVTGKQANVTARTTAGVAVVTPADPIRPSKPTVTKSALNAAIKAAKDFQSGYAKVYALHQKVRRQRQLEDAVAAGHQALVAKGVDPNKALQQILSHPSIRALAKSGLYVGTRQTKRSNLSGFWGLLGLGDERDDRAADCDADPSCPGGAAWIKARIADGTCANQPQCSTSQQWAQVQAASQSDGVQILTNCESKYQTDASRKNCVAAAGNQIAIDCVNRYQTHASRVNCIRDAEDAAAASTGTKPSYCSASYPAGSPYGGNWDFYCACEYDDPAIISKCKVCPTRLPVTNDCISPPPWTEVGAAMRGIPKAHGEISLLANIAGSALDELPSPDDLKPVNLMRIALTDPIKYTVVTAASAIIPGLTLYVAMFTTPIGFLVAMEDAGGWDQLWASPAPQGGTFRDAVEQSLGQGVEFVIGWFIGGGLIAAAIKAGLQTFARNAKDPVTRAFVNALADASGDVALAIKIPDRWTNPAFYNLLGGFFRNASQAASTDKDAAAALGLIGDVLGAVIAPILMLVNGPSGTPTPPTGPADVLRRRQMAEDEISIQILGVRLSTLRKLPHEQWGQVATVDQGVYQTFKNAVPALQQFAGTMTAFGHSLDDLVKSGVAALKGIGINIPGLDNFLIGLLIKPLTDAFADFQTLIDGVSAAIDTITAKQQATANGQTPTTQNQSTQSDTEQTTTTVTATGLSSRAKLGIGIAGAGGAGLLSYVLAHAGVLAPVALVGLSGLSLRHRPGGRRRLASMYRDRGRHRR